MKKISTIILAVALVMALMVPFAASADDVVTLSVPEVKAEAGADVEVVITMSIAAGEYIMDGDFTIEFDAEKLTLDVAEKTGPADPANNLTTLPGPGQVNADDKADGIVLVAFADANGLVDAGEGVTVIKLPFKVAADLEEGTEAEVTITANRLLRYVEGDVVGENLCEEEPIVASGKVVVKAAEKEEPTPTETKPTDPEEPTPTDPKPTDPPKETGESTPWALIATVAAAGAALVVLSTKKSK